MGFSHNENLCDETVSTENSGGAALGVFDLIIRNMLLSPSRHKHYATQHSYPKRKAYCNDR